MPQNELRYEEIADALDEYVRAHIDPEPPLLHRIQRLTHLRLTYPRMCSGHLQGRLLRMLCQLTGAHRILELGTYSGYSTLSMAEALTPDANGHQELHTIEVFDELEDFLTEVMAEAGPLAANVHLHFGDALQLVPDISREVAGRCGCPQPWDVVFIDADKRLYSQFYEGVLPYVRHGGLIIADNTLWDGKVLDPAPRPSDTQTLGLQAFNDAIAADTRIEKVILPMRDGLTLIRVK